MTLALDALKTALEARQPPSGLPHHSERGSQYASHEYQALLAEHGIVGSMSRLHIVLFAEVEAPESARHHRVQECVRLD